MQPDNKSSNLDSSSSSSSPPAYESPPSSKDNLAANPFASTSQLSIDDCSEKNLNIAQEEQAIASQPNSSSKWKFILRIAQLLCVIGSFGFQVSAGAWSGRKTIPFDSIALLYFFYSIEWFAFIWSSFCIYVQLSLRFSKNQHAGNIKPAIGLAMDALLSLLLGIGISMEIATYSCPAGSFDGWCNFYNIGVSFGMLLFITFSTSALWDLFAGLSCLRTDG